MEIQKIFSNNQDNEKLYTVLMNDDELRLYSEFQIGVYPTQQNYSEKVYMAGGTKKNL